jgi:hypothetical protein
LSVWPLIIENAGIPGGVIVAVVLGVRYGSDPLLRLIAGLVAIAARDNRSRAERALAVLRTFSGKNATD